MRFFSLLLLLLLTTIVYAQEFVYVSGTADQTTATKLFLYQNGQNKPLTIQPDDAAYDPVPSRDGTQLAYVEKSLIGSWSLIVIAFNGDEISRWKLPGSQGTFRPAGGFSPTWLDDSSLLALVPASNGWDIFEFRKATSPKRVTEGYGIFLNDDTTQLLTNVGDDVVLFDLKIRKPGVIETGQVWGWSNDDRAVISREGNLYSVKSVGDEELLAETGAAFLAHFAWSPSQTHFAIVDMNDEGAFLSIYNGQEKILEQPLGNAVDTLEWLDDNTLLISVVYGEEQNYDNVIVSLGLDGTLRELVNSDGADYMAKPIPSGQR
jgi:hypothetical protein